MAGAVPGRSAGLARAGAGGPPLTLRWRFLPAHANGQLAFGTYLWDEGKAVFVAAGLDLLELRGTKVAGVVSFLDADIFPLFGLPRQVDT